MEHAFDSLMSYFPIKVVVGVLMAFVFNAEAIIFMSFAWLVFLDCFTRWIAISYGFLLEQGEEKPSLWTSIKGIPAARRAGVINSHAMRTQFVQKFFVYMLLVVAGALVDFMPGRSEFANLVIAYLASSELLSIVENLDDAGVSAVHDLAGLIKRKRV